MYNLKTIARSNRGEQYSEKYAKSPSKIVENSSADQKNWMLLGENQRAAANK